MPTWPASLARSAAVQAGVLSEACVCMLGSALPASSIATQASCPLLAAQCSAVKPSGPCNAEHQDYDLGQFKLSACSVATQAVCSCPVQACASL